MTAISDSTCLFYKKTIAKVLLSTLPFFSNGQTQSVLNHWLEKNTTPVKQDTTSYIHLNSDHFKSKTIIALGEPTHGTGDAQLSRFKLFKFLVEHCETRYSALEAVSNSVALNDYLLYGKGSAGNACAELNMWMYSTKETESMINWIRAYNRTKLPDQKIKFYGIDYALNKVDGKSLRDSLSGIISASLIDTIVSASEKHPNQKNYNKSILIAEDNALSILEDSLQTAKTAILQSLSATYFNEVSYLLKTLRQTTSALIFGKNIPKGYRDSCMAENVRYISSFSNNAKLMVGAHNAHVKIQDLTMGYFLRNIFRDRFYSIGTLTSRGTFRAFAWNKEKSDYQLVLNQIDQYPKHSMGERLKSASIKSFFIDFNSCTKDQIFRQLFIEPKFNINAGWLYDAEHAKKYYVCDRLSNSYNAVFYFDETYVQNPLTRMLLCPRDFNNLRTSITIC